VVMLEGESQWDVGASPEGGKGVPEAGAQKQALKERVKKGEGLDFKGAGAVVMLEGESQWDVGASPEAGVGWSGRQSTGE